MTSQQPAFDLDDSWEAAQEQLAEAGVTDGLPVIPPTPERVERFLKAAGVDPAKVLAVLPPVMGEVTWQAVAINAVLAGCRPEYLPVIGAAAAALADDDFNLMGIQTTTGSATPLLIVNGPIVGRLRMNAEGNALGPGNRANATIGRAIRLLLQNVGGAHPGELDMATLGQPAKFTFCLAENEAASPWEPLHVERGFAAAESVVTVVGAAGIVEIVDSASVRGEDLIRTLAQSLLIPGTLGGSGYLGGGQPLILLPPEHAAILDRDGFTKRTLQATIWNEAQLPLDRLSPGVRDHLRQTREAAGHPDPESALRVAERPEDILIVVAGGVGIKAAYVPSWGGSTRAVSRRIE
ncbi:MAG TPA: hypothetical protein VHL09_08745 [Dehalococcoidia bacterium]|nr:hypothetical protein [Dehalococcoidia bacterium]